jgi:hypothetical protein
MHESSNSVRPYASQGKPALADNFPESPKILQAYAGHIYRMHQGDQAYNQKKITQNAYFLELARQIQEKSNPINSSKPTTSTNPENSSKSSNSTENPNLDSLKTPEIKYSRYQKKYEIENHTKIHTNTTQMFGGVLQRDETFLNKLKKIDQQNEIKQNLTLQIQEKNKIKEKIKKKNTDNDKLNEYNQNRLENAFLEENQNVCNDKVIAEEKDSVDSKGQKTLNEFYRKLVKEKEDLACLFNERQKKLRDLENALTPKKQESFKRNKKPGKAFVVGQSTRTREPSPKNNSLKFQQGLETIKCDFVREDSQKIKGRSSQASKRTSKKAQERVSDPKIEFKPSKETSPLPKTPETELYTVYIPKDKEIDRGSLDTAGKSYFIYPDSQGNFKIEDEIDKFVVNYQRKGISANPTVSFSENTKNPKFSISAMTFIGKKLIRPLVANKAGFPSDVFKVPS